jgi:UDP-N-acetylglucosamine diphosphorylase / glucose-1-phosphate thymidylyltransferase / UDP-N-acetylgalactosamine diphosphorylase / glucosamine-1-phosphate N-acetyltransferase / galactosamine-1-phosphate N-acetyltransferase
MKQSEARTAQLLDLSHTMAKPLLETCEYPWEALEKIHGWILETGPELPEDEWDHPSEYVWIHKSVRIVNPANYTILGPAIIGADSEIRPGAFIRSDVVIGEGVVIGNSCEYKNCIIFDGAETPHYNYIGDSILGYRSHTGAQALTSNVRSDKKHVIVHLLDGDIDTGRKKVGAILGDHAEAGCGTVLNPGSVIGRGSIVQPLSSVRGCVDAGCIYKQNGVIVKIEERS